MARKSNKISTRRIRETCDDFRTFLDETNFPDPERLGERGPKFKLCSSKIWAQFRRF